MYFIGVFAALQGQFQNENGEEIDGAFQSQISFRRNNQYPAHMYLQILIIGQSSQPQPKTLPQVHVQLLVLLSDRISPKILRKGI